MPDVIDLKPKTKPADELPPASLPAQADLPDQIEWTALEFEKEEKNPLWHLIGGLIVVGLIAVAVFALNNILFALIVFLAGVAIFIYSKKEPNQTKFKLSGKGIQIDKALYPYINLKSFWIFYDPPKIKYLSIESKKLALPYMKISLADQDPVELRSFLIQFLPEKQQEESLVDTIARGLRF